MPPALVLATANPNKAVELRRILGDRFSIAPRPEGLADTIEDGETLEANALKKAFEVAAVTKRIALADDTGLFVAALGGAPGVRSARYAGETATDEENTAKLLAALEEQGRAGSEDRSAWFETVIAVVWPDGRQLLANGRVDGVIAVARTGHGGFGYDPIFVPSDGDGRSFAQMNPVEKNRISHRGRALTALKTTLSV